MKNLKFTFLLLFITTTFFAQQISLVKDINPSNTENGISGFARFAELSAGIFLFVANDAEHGFEIWRTDGTPEGTFMVKDINDGEDSGLYSGEKKFVLNGQCYFSADDGLTGTELWKTDGTPEGTVQVMDIDPGSGSSFPTILGVYNDAIYFSADNGSSGSGKELWKTDGTDEGTVLVKDIYPGQSFNSSFPNNFAILNDLMYFFAKGNGSDNELWQTDGTDAGTVMVKEITSFITAAFPRGLVSLNGKMYFYAGTNGSNTGEPWVSDGTTAGTQILKQIGDDADANVEDFTAFQDKVYFIAQTNIWRTDGTTAGTEQVGSLNTGNFGTTAFSPFVVFDNRLFVSATSSGEGQELHVSSGGDFSPFYIFEDGFSDGEPEQFYVFGDELLFTADVFGEGREVWRTDGTSAGTMLVEEIVAEESGSTPTGFLALDEENVLFTASTFELKRELYKYEKMISANNTLNTKVPQVLAMPNPTDRFITLKSKNASTVSFSRCDIVDLNGKVVHAEIVPEHTSEVTIDLKTVAQGIYIYLLYSAENKLIERGQLIKQ